MKDILFYIGQGFGILTVLLGFLNYQAKTRKSLLFIHLSTTLCFALHYGLIGAFAGMAMNLVGTVRDTTFAVIEKSRKVNRWYSIGFAIIMAIMGIISWEAWYSIIVVIALTINSYAMSFTNPNDLRKSILVTSPMVLIYDILAHAYGGTVYETVAIISAIIGLYRYRKNGEVNNN